MMTLRVLFGAIKGGVFGWALVMLWYLAGLPTREYAATWIAIFFAIDGAVVARFGSRYWHALWLETADFDEDEKKTKLGETESGSTSKG